MADGIRIYRGTNQIGGIVTEIRKDDNRILIDFGANLPGTKETAIKDEEIVRRVLWEEPYPVKTSAVLFTHYHGDHVGLKGYIPDGIPMYVGRTAKEIMKVIAKRVDYMKKKTGSTDAPELPVIARMKPYWKAGTEKDFEGIRVKPLICDHSALDAYMFVIEMNGKRILYTGDFRDHGIPGANTFEKMIREKVGKVDILVTEGTMVSRFEEEKSNTVRTEGDLGAEAAKIFASHHENVVLVSSTNLDSIMEFYNAVPEGKVFLCDPYQAEVMKIAIEARYKYFRKYQFNKQIYVLCPGEYDGYMKSLLEYRIPWWKERCPFSPAIPDKYLKTGFVMLARPNRNPNVDIGRFEERMLDMKDPYITYSMWNGYLKGGKAEDPAVVRFMDGHMDKEHMEELHTSGHAYVETLKKLMDMTEPEIIIPMHTEDREAFKKVPLFRDYTDRIHVTGDGELFQV
ncbi:MAG: MBL fold metallo-hydrolase [Lachnospiraceae bacterium]|nr:MBL fold metallo-hydrolase [Lachnospiraceae bacterium]